ncbi:MAG: hypothetical protein IJ927_07395 [Eubacterium sp.]|nr:hypothetical protein [Eubacterium sp.]
MKRFFPIILSITAVAFGIVFVISGIKTIANKDLFDTQITATVVDIQEELQIATDPEGVDEIVNVAYIDYEYGGKKFEHVESPEQNNKLKIGDTVEILVQSKNPEKISALNPTKGGIIFIVVGAVAAIAGGLSALKLFIRKR